MYINNIIFIVYDKGWYWVVYLKSVENVITLGKLIGLLFLFCHPLFSILFLKNKRNDLARLVMGTIFLVTAFNRLNDRDKFKYMIMYLIVQTLTKRLFYLGLKLQQSTC